MNEKEIKEEQVVEEEKQPDVAGPISFPRLGVILISVLLGLIVILAIIIAIL